MCCAVYRTVKPLVDCTASQGSLVRLSESATQALQFSILFRVGAECRLAITKRNYADSIA